MSNAHQMDDESWNNFWYGLGAVVLVGPLVLWQRFIGLLVEHQVLVAGGRDPLLVIPKADGAGLDVARLVLLLGVLVAVTAIAWVATRRRASRKEQNR